MERSEMAGLCASVRSLRTTVRHMEGLLSALNGSDGAPAETVTATATMMLLARELDRRLDLLDGQIHRMWTEPSQDETPYETVYETASTTSMEEEE